ncbi:MAG: type IV secretion system protein [Synergistaceae bacterium]|jgi:type IV secretion system protein VirB5|nr:type IV secretion system protein [Synergistaceae bacterium]
MSQMKKEKGSADFSAAVRELFDPDNPYALGRKEYDDRYERLAKNAASWRRAAFLTLLLLSVSTGVVLWMAQTVKVVPFVVQVDRHGYEIAVQPAEAHEVTDDRVVMARIADFISNTRSVYSDATAMMNFIGKAYNSVESSSPALRKLDTWFRENNPFAKGEQVVNVTAQSVLRASPDSNITWQAEWSEKTYDRGLAKEEHFFKGTFTVEFRPPTNIADIMKNPLGIFISDFTISERIS